MERRLLNGKLWSQGIVQTKKIGNDVVYESNFHIFFQF